MPIETETISQVSIGPSGHKHVGVRWESQRTPPRLCPVYVHLPISQLNLKNIERHSFRWLFHPGMARETQSVDELISTEDSPKYSPI